MRGLEEKQENNSTTIRFSTTFNGEELQKKEWIILEKDSLQFTKVRYYISNIRFINKQNKSIPCEECTYLIDAFDSESQDRELPIAISKLKKIQFDLGIDENTNTSGAHGGDLDPANGMYWSWQSGYINAKIEGISPSCATRKNKFQFHIGGYAAPNPTIRTVTIPIQSSGEIQLDLATFFKKTAWTKAAQLMRPGKEASALASILSNSFTNHE